MTEELYSADDVLGSPVEKKVKSKAERKLLKPKETEVEVTSGTKRSRDDVEKSFEEKRARKLAKQDKVKVKGMKSVKA
jgi:hypothetical protein